MRQYYLAQMFYFLEWEAIQIFAYQSSRKDCSINILSLSYHFVFRIVFEIAKTGISVHSCHVEF